MAGHRGTKLVNHPGPVAVGHDARILHRRGTTPPIGVGWVDAGSFEPHAHFAVARLGGREFAADQNLISCSLPVVPNRAHGRPPLLWPRRRSIMFPRAQSATTSPRKRAPS